MAVFKGVFYLFFLSISFKTSAQEIRSESSSKSICLNMIVKNEKEVIARCLQSVMPLIDTWVIVDTGSTDGTQEVIRDCMKQKPGELHERKWVNFEYNRNEALALAKGKADYLLFMDADDVLAWGSSFKLPDLTKDFYAIMTKRPDEEFWFPRLVRADLPWYWAGAIHEDLLCGKTVEGQTLDHIAYLYFHDGARGKDPETVQKDIAILLESIAKEPKNPRNYFYLANSYALIEEYEKALHYFALRSAMEGGAEETFAAKLAVGKLHMKLGYPFETIRQSFLEAYKAGPSHAEPLYYLVKNFQKRGEIEKAYELARSALDLPKPYHIVEKPIYDFELLLALAETSSDLGKTQECLAACEKLLAKDSLSKNHRSAVEQLKTSQLHKSLQEASSKITALIESHPKGENK